MYYITNLSIFVPVLGSSLKNSWRLIVTVVVEWGSVMAPIEGSSC